MERGISGKGREVPRCLLFTTVAHLRFIMWSNGMLPRETPSSVLASPAATPAPREEVRWHFQPDWKASASSHALVLTGVRRSGKSTLQGRIRRGVKGRAVTLNLEDTRLYGFGPEDFATLPSSIRTTPGGGLPG